MGGPKGEIAMSTVEQPSRSLWADAMITLRRRLLTRVCMVIIAVYAGLALYGEFVYWGHKIMDTTPAYKETNLAIRYLPPSFIRAPEIEEDGNRTLAWLTALPNHPLGTDGLGRDVLQRVIQGTRIAFEVGFITACIAIPIGLILGCIAGYFGGRIDDFIVWLYSTFASIPTLLFILTIAMMVGKGMLGVFLGIGLTTWVGLCRLIRGEVIKHKARPYVLAAKSLGLGDFRIIFKHILPNVMHLVIVTFTIRFPAAINTEVILSFLGIGVQGEPSWGEMISAARLRLWQGVWWEMAAATLAIFFIVLAFNLLGDALRDALDPKLKTERA